VHHPKREMTRDQAKMGIEGGSEKGREWTRGNARRDERRASVAHAPNRAARGHAYVRGEARPSALASPVPLLAGSRRDSYVSNRAVLQGQTRNYAGSQRRPVSKQLKKTESTCTKYACYLLHSSTCSRSEAGWRCVRIEGLPHTFPSWVNQDRI
jgi:hypothetical protein